MVATDGTTVWDLKPNRENTNQIFNVLCNVVPTPHPWYGEGYRRQIDVTAGEKQQYWFEKCKGLKKCQLFKYDCNKLTKINEQAPLEKAWENSNFTDVILFQGYRIYMRKSSALLNPYGTKQNLGFTDAGSDGNPDTCDEGSRPSNIAKNRNPDPSLVSKDIVSSESSKPGVGRFEDTYTSSERIRIYIQQVDTKLCSGDSFDEADESPIILVKEYQAAPCNPDRFIRGVGGIGVPRIICHNKEINIAMIFKEGQHFAYIYGKNLSVSPTEVVYLQDQGIYLSGLYKPRGEENDIITGVSLPLGGYFIPEVSELMQLFKIPQVDKDSGILTDAEVTPLTSSLKIFKEYGEIPYFAAGGDIVGIHGLFSAQDCNIPDECEIDDVIKDSQIKDTTACKARDVKPSDTRFFLYDTNITAARNRYPITGLSTRGSRIAYIANGMLYVSGNGRMQGVFGSDLSAQGDATRGPRAIPAGLTDLKEMYGSLLLFGPKAIHAIKDENMLKAGVFLKASDTEDGYYGPGAYYNDDGEFLIVRRGKVLETMQYSAYYGTIQFTPDTGFFVNSHIKGCNPEFDKINIDATINHRYVSIFDNYHVPNKPHRSKLLIYDKHYNVWYHRMIVGARVIHVKDGIFLGDGVYVNKGRTWGWTEDDTKGGEIIEIISAYVGEEGLQAPKQIQYVKTAIGDRSRITKDSKWSIITSIGGKSSERRVDITTTRHPQLLDLKEQNGIIKEYNSGEVITGHGQLLTHNLGNEFDEYLSYDKYDTPIQRQLSSMDDLTTKLARFASIKEAVNVPANVIQISISSRYLDSVQFGSFYVAYFMLDADFEDIENTNMDISDYGDTTNPNSIDINRGEYCDEVLAGSACDISYDDKLLDGNP